MKFSFNICWNCLKVFSLVVLFNIAQIASNTTVHKGKLVIDGLSAQQACLVVSLERDSIREEVKRAVVIFWENLLVRSLPHYKKYSACQKSQDKQDQKA